MRTNPDGTIDVRVTLTVQVDPNAWAEHMMAEDPDELTQKDVRRDVKREIRDRVAMFAERTSNHNDDVPVPIGDVRAEGLYDVSPVTRSA